MSQIFDEHNQMIIRFPEEIAQQLNQYFLNGGEQPEVTLQADYQQKETNPRVSLKVGVNGENYKATVVQLPTVSSTFKTIDRVNFFKSNDISEMIVVHENEYDIINESQAETILQRNGGIYNKKKLQKKHKNTWQSLVCQMRHTISGKIIIGKGPMFPR